MQVEEYRFFQMPYTRTGALEYKKQPPSVKVLYQTFCRLAFQYGDRKTGWFFHSMKDLCVESNLSLKTVKIAKSRLMKLDLIEVKRGHRVSDHYRSADAYKINGLRCIGKLTG